MSAQTIPNTSRLVLFATGVAILIAFLYELLRGSWSDVFQVFQAMVLSTIPYLFGRYYNVRVPNSLYAGIVAFLFGTLILGEIQNFYREIWWWDILLHGFAGIGLTIIGFIMLLLVFKKQNVRSYAVISSVFAFTFAMGFAVFWEVYEFTVDHFFSPEHVMQPSNFDTMTDVIAAVVSGLVVTVLGYIYIRHGRSVLLADVIEEGEEQNKTTTS